MIDEDGNEGGKEDRMEGSRASEERVDEEEEGMAWERRARARAVGSGSERTSGVGDGCEAVKAIRRGSNDSRWGR